MEKRGQFTISVPDSLLTELAVAMAPYRSHSRQRLLEPVVVERIREYIANPILDPGTESAGTEEADELEAQATGTE